MTEQQMSLDKYEKDLEIWIERTRERRNRIQDEVNKNKTQIDQILSDKKALGIEKLRTLVLRIIDGEMLERLTTEIIHLQLMSMLAFHVDNFGIIMAGAINNLTESGVLQKKDLEELKKTKKDLDRLKQLMNEQYENMQKQENIKEQQEEKGENTKKDLSYIG